MRSALSLTMVLLALAGCRAGDQPCEILAYKDPTFPERYALDLADARYRKTHEGSYELAARAVRELGDLSVTQYLRIRLFWRPVPGRTHADKTGTNARVEYLIATATGATLYKGSGFGYPTLLRDGTLRLDLERSELRFAGTSGDVGDPLGPIRITGTLRAAPGAAAAVGWIRELEQRAPRE